MEIDTKNTCLMDSPGGHKVIGYARVSTPSQELDVQRDMIQKYCKDKGFDLIDILEDKMSGKKDDRPNWQRVMNAVRGQKVHAVVFVRADRVARSVKNLLETVDEFQKSGVKFISITEPMFADITSPQGKLIVTVMGAIAEFEANLIRERMLEGRRRAEVVGTKSGLPMHRPEKKIDWKKYDELKRLGVPTRRIARELGISPTKIYSAIAGRG